MCTSELGPAPQLFLGPLSGRSVALCLEGLDSWSRLGLVSFTLLSPTQVTVSLKGFELQTGCCCRIAPDCKTIGMGVVWTSPGSGGVDSGVTGSGGGTLGLVAMALFQVG